MALDKTIMFTIVSEDPIVARVIEEDDKYFYVDYPLTLLRDNMHLYMMPYMHFAKDGLVMINKNNIVGLANLDDNMVMYYDQMVVLYREKDSNTKLKIHQEDFKEISNNTSKILH